MLQPVPSLTHILDDIRSDQSHGSRIIAIRMLKDLESWSRTNPTETEALRDFVAALSEVRPSMSVFSYLARALRTALEPAEHFQQQVASLIRQLQDSDRIIGQQFRALCCSRHYTRILTHSRSSTVESVLAQAGKEGVVHRVFCTESRPGYEGVALATALQKTVPVTLITDTNVVSVLGDVDCVVLGADAIDEEGNIRNKVGSRMLALLAREEQKPVVVLADRSKWQTVSLSTAEEEHDPAELGHDLPGITVLNTYFEKVSNTLITMIISDKREGV